MDAELRDIELVDHHCHGLVTRELDRPGFEALLTEAAAPTPLGGSPFDSQIGFALRRWCPPLLDLEPHADPDAYLARRAELGAAEVNRRLLTATGTRTFLVDTGYLPEPITTPAELAGVVGGTGHEVVRLEQVASDVLGAVGAGAFPDAFRIELGRRCATAVGVKSIAAYRAGLALPADRPDDAAVVAAADRQLAGGSTRVADPVLHAFGVWSGIDLGLPVQFHTGMGDADTDLRRGDPLLLTDLLRATEPHGVPVVLLHTYPFQRHAGYLAQVFGHVFCDVSLATHNLGARSAAVLPELLELAPFGKVLFASDAFGLAELYLLGTWLFRRALGGHLAAGVADGAWTAADAQRVAAMIGADNARRVYRL